jgi:ribosomal protein S25
MWEYYNAKQEREAGSGSGRTVSVSPRWDATLTEDAWKRYNMFEASMVNSALESSQPDLLVPVMDRLAKSGLKAAVLMAASRMDGPVKITESDLVRAFWYVERWREYTLEVIHNVGKSADERILERIYRAIERQPGIARSTIMQNFRLTASRADAIFATLSQRGLIQQQHHKGKGTKLHAVIDA